MYTWTSEGNASVISMSDDTDHGAAAVFASIEPILMSFVAAGKKEIDVISDSPLSQYRNKSIFWYIKKFAEKHKVTVRWIYLEAGHGKGIPDGLGAVMKCTICALVDMSPDIPMYTAEDLLENGLQDMLPSINIQTFTTADITKKQKQLPVNLATVTGTLMFHEVTAQLEGNSVKMLASKLSGDERKVITVK